LSTEDTPNDDAIEPTPEETPETTSPSEPTLSEEADAASEAERPRVGSDADASPESADQEPAPAAEERAPAEEAQPQPAAEEQQPAAQEEPGPAAEGPAPAAEQSPSPGEQAPSLSEQAPAPGEQAPAPAAEESEAVELPPRQRPEIPGADLIPDIIPESEEFLDAEARAAAEAEAEARAAREREQHEDVESRPIADAAIDLGAGARYTATGKRKTAVARVILKPGSGSYAINGKPLDDFFPRETLRRVIRQPLESVGYDSRMDVVARMHGGGVSAQAEALRHGISRALIEADPHLRGELKRRGFLTRDPRVKERKKAGLKKARKRPQFSKR
jgi:small subunit ribosomal protein S9